MKKARRGSDATVPSAGLSDFATTGRAAPRVSLARRTAGDVALGAVHAVLRVMGDLVPLTLSVADAMAAQAGAGRFFLMADHAIGRIRLAGPLLTRRRRAALGRSRIGDRRGRRQKRPGRQAHRDGACVPQRNRSAFPTVIQD